jgi:hypothetical protein
VAITQRSRILIVQRMATCGHARLLYALPKAFAVLARIATARFGRREVGREKRATWLGAPSDMPRMNACIAGVVCGVMTKIPSRIQIANTASVASTAIVSACLTAMTTLVRLAF